MTSCQGPETLTGPRAALVQRRNRPCRQGGPWVLFVISRSVGFGTGNGRPLSACVMDSAARRLAACAKASTRAWPTHATPPRQTRPPECPPLKLGTTNSIPPRSLAHTRACDNNGVVTGTATPRSTNRAGMCSASPFLAAWTTVAIARRSPPRRRPRSANRSKSQTRRHRKTVQPARRQPAIFRSPPSVLPPRLRGLHSARRPTINKVLWRSPSLPSWPHAGGPAGRCRRDRTGPTPTLVKGLDL